MTQYEEIITDFITGTHLSEFKGYYELDVVNEFSSTRYVFHIPKNLFDMMIFSKKKFKPTTRQMKARKPKPVPMMTS